MQKISLHKLRKLAKKSVIYKDKSLKQYTTFKIGGNCDYLIEIATIEDFTRIVKYLEEIKIDFFVIGNGSNLLISDKGYRGVVIKLTGDFCEVQTSRNYMECGAGVLLSKAYMVAKDTCLSGLECSGGIPASVGGATFMNAQAYDFEIAKIVDYVLAYVDGKITFFDNKSCEFGYRNSIFQKNNGIILKVVFKLTPAEKSDITSRYLEIVSKRKSTQPIGVYTAGCVFRNKDGMSAGKLLDEGGFKGKSRGEAYISEKHANFFVNNDNASANDVYRLVLDTQNEFEKMYNIRLDCELRFLGEFYENDE